MSSPLIPLEVGLNAAIVTTRQAEPFILVIPGKVKDNAPKEKTLSDSLPFGPFSPLNHRTLEIGLRSWVSEQTGLDLGYVEQLYTFGDRGRHIQRNETDPHFLSIGYLALTRGHMEEDLKGAAWQSWYNYFPWEDWRKAKPDILAKEIEPRLHIWAKRKDNDPAAYRSLKRDERLRICFGLNGGTWDEEKVLERYELLYEAGLVNEAVRDQKGQSNTEVEIENWDALPALGKAMIHDHRRILATAMGRLRAKIKYRPVIFELMTDTFTLFELQKNVEAISGTHLHKQNFRRLVESAGLVEPTETVSQNTGGRPAKLYRFRREVLLERPAPGVRLSAKRG